MWYFIVLIWIIIIIQAIRIHDLNNELAETKRKALLKAVQERVKEDENDSVFGRNEQVRQKGRKEWRTSNTSVTNRGVCRSNSSSIEVPKEQDKRELRTHTRRTSRCNESKDATSTSI